MNILIYNQSTGIWEKLKRNGKKNELHKCKNQTSAEKIVVLMTLNNFSGKHHLSLNKITLYPTLLPQHL